MAGSQGLFSFLGLAEGGGVTAERWLVLKDQTFADLSGLCHIRSTMLAREPTESGFWSYLTEEGRDGVGLVMIILPSLDNYTTLLVV